MLGFVDGSVVYLALHPVDLRRGIAALSSYAGASWCSAGFGGCGGFPLSASWACEGPVS